MENVVKIEAIMAKNIFDTILAYFPYTLNMTEQKWNAYNFVKISFKEDFKHLESLAYHLYKFYLSSHKKRV